MLGPVLFLCLLVDLPGVISNSSINSAIVGSSGYADDCVVWAASDDADTVKANLESISSSISTYMNEHCLVLNQEKTQVLWVGDAGRNSSVMVGGTLVAPSSTVDILGVSFDSHLTPAPYMAAVLRAARTLAGASRRLSLQLRQPVLQQVVRALLVGKVGYACAVLKPRLSSSDPLQKDLVAIQVAINYSARAVTSSNRSNKLPIPALLNKAALPSLNQLIVEQIALETWKGMNYVSDGIKSPIGEILCPTGGGGGRSSSSTARTTRATATNCIPPPTRTKSETFAWRAYQIWNGSPLLRSANTLDNARKIAKDLAQSVPI